MKRESDQQLPSVKNYEEAHTELIKATVDSLKLFSEAVIELFKEKDLEVVPIIPEENPEQDKHQNIDKEYFKLSFSLSETLRYPRKVQFLPTGDDFFIITLWEDPSSGTNRFPTWKKIPSKELENRYPDLFKNIETKIPKDSIPALIASLAKWLRRG
jgi:hypothetical protein